MNSEARNLLMRERLSTGKSARAQPPIRLFKSDLIERFTRTSVTTIILFWLPVSCGALGLGIGQGRLTDSAVAAVVVAGVAAWMLVEYLLHRFVFHLDRWIPAAARFCYLIHGCHHADPSDPSRDIMPLIGSVPMMCVVLASATSGLGQASGLVFFGAFGLAYLAYDVTHYGCHQWSFPGWIGAHLQRHHLSHHYLDGARHFGVTSPLWDWVFRTMRLGRRHG